MYDNETNDLLYEDGRPVFPPVEKSDLQNAPTVSIETPGNKRTPRTLKISLGLSCNYECEYCSQRFVPRADETNKDDVQGFVADLDKWVTTPPERIEFWGGEPFVYIKTLKPLLASIKKKYPLAQLLVITNGSLLTLELNDWIDRSGLVVGISHDGPGQYVRGPDPLDDPEKKAAILDLYRRLAPQKRISFNACLTNKHFSRKAIQDFFINLTCDQGVSIGEGTMVDAYDKGGLGCSLTESQNQQFRNLTFAEIRAGHAKNFQIVPQKIRGFIESLRTRRPASTLGQKCSMDKPDNMAVDLRGNVLTCQNVSATSTAPNGQPHKIGHVSDLANVKLNTATHWSYRDECPKCPVLHLCQGACMFLEGPLFAASCDSSYSDNVVMFAAAIEFVTGLVPIYIDGDFREGRKDIFGMVNGVTDATPNRVIPIHASA